jgi:hypothetical protein
VGLIRFRGEAELRINRERVTMLEEDIRSRLLRKQERASSDSQSVNLCENSRYRLYSRIIDENIALR